MALVVHPEVGVRSGHRRWRGVGPGFCALALALALLLISAPAGAGRFQTVSGPSVAVPSAGSDRDGGDDAARGHRASRCPAAPAPTGVLRACYYRGIGRHRQFLGSLDEPGLASPAPDRVFAIDHRWGTGPVFGDVAPAAGGAANDITVEWQGRIRFTGGDYHLSVLTSGDATLSVDGRKVGLERWEVQPERRTRALHLDRGLHRVKLTWTMAAQAGKDTRLRLHWDRVPTTRPARQSTLQVDALIMTSQDLCIGGDPWTDGPQVVLRDPDGTPYRAWQVDEATGRPGGFAPGDPIGDTMSQVECFTAGFTGDEIGRIQENLSVFAGTVRSWSFGAIDLDVRVHRLSGPAGPTRAGLGFWVGPWSLYPLAAPTVTPDTDFVIAFTPNRDIATGRRFDFGLAGGSLGVQHGIGGAGYSWLGTADPLVILHEWEHQLTDVMNNLIGFHGIYPDTVMFPASGYPACGQGGTDIHAWFPDSHEWGVEPDSPWCGQPGEDVGLAEMHLLAHVDRSLRHYPLGRIVGNHCRDGVTDYGETSVDAGGRCPADPTDRSGPAAPAVGSAPIPPPAPPTPPTITS